jgi:hypothetical protein
VTAVAPLAGATGVPINNTIITADFSEPMSPITGAASFTVTCAAPCVSPTGTVALDVTNRIATFTAAANLTPLTLYTATVTGAKSLATGLTLVSPYVWTFTTGATLDVIKPRVSSTFPANLAAAVPTNTAITAVFNEAMAPLTINSLSPAVGSFTLTCAAGTTPGVCVTPTLTGNVNYAVGSKTATFTPTPAGTLLEAGKTYTATITTAATDLAGNQLAGGLVGAPNPTIAANYAWTFTTAATPVPPGNIAVLSTQTACPNAVNATFTVPSGLPLNTVSVQSNFTVTGVGPAFTPVLGSVVVDLTNKIATFTPTVALTPGTSYIATITGGANGVKDTAVTPNTLNMAAYTLTFTPGPATGACLPPVPLGAAATFGSVGGTTGATNTGIFTVINGDFGSTSVATVNVTGFHDSAPSDIYTETGANIGSVTGKIYTCTVSTTGPTSGGVNAASCTVAGNALAAAQTAYNTLAGLAPGLDPSGAGGELGGLTITPGTYTTATSFKVGSGNLTLDAQGNANAVWVFQMGSTLTVGDTVTPRSILLINGAQAKNVFWQVGSSATINGIVGSGTIEGNILAAVKVTFSTVGVAAVTTLNGRAVGLTAQTVINNTVINVPAP